MKVQPSFWARILPMVVLPEPDTPIRTTIMIAAPPCGRGRSREPSGTGMTRSRSARGTYPKQAPGDLPRSYPLSAAPVEKNVLGSLTADPAPAGPGPMPFPEDFPMAYKCPRCGEDVRRGQSTAAGVVGGLVGILVASAFAPFLCDRCGTIPRSEFSASDRAEMIIGS